MAEAEITLRVAAKEDAPELLKIYSHYVEKTAITFEWEVPSVEEFETRIQKVLEKYPYIVAEKQGQLLGYAYASPFKQRAAYDWSIETSIYVHKDFCHLGIGKILLLKLEALLKKQNILNAYACIAYPEIVDEYLDRNSVEFHTKMGYRLVGEYKKCGYKFNRWYNMVWMEKMLGNHEKNQPSILKFDKNWLL